MFIACIILALIISRLEEFHQEGNIRMWAKRQGVHNMQFVRCENILNYVRLVEHGEVRSSGQFGRQMGSDCTSDLTNGWE
jgi:hypothetical protein